MDVQTLWKVAICAMTALIHLIVTITFWVTFWKRKESTPNMTPVKIASLVFLSNILWSVINIFFALDEVDGILSVEISISTNIIITTVIISSITFYINRLCTSFQDSIYEINSKTVIIFVVLTTLAGILIFLADLVFAINGDRLKDGSKNFFNFNYHQTLFLMFSIATGIVAFEYISIAFIFAYKLFQITLQQRVLRLQHHHYRPRPPTGQRSLSPMVTANSQVSTPSITPTAQNCNGTNIASAKHKTSANVNNPTVRGSGNVSVNIDTLRGIQLIFIETITKQSLLILSPFIGMISFTVFMVLRSIIPHNPIVDVGRYLVLGFATIEFCVAIWLSFSFATKEYQLCCKFGHKMLHQSCVKLAVRQLLN